MLFSGTTRIFRKCDFSRGTVHSLYDILNWVALYSWGGVDNVIYRNENRQSIQSHFIAKFFFGVCTERQTRRLISEQSRAGFWFFFRKRYGVLIFKNLRRGSGAGFGFCKSQNRFGKSKPFTKDVCWFGHSERSEQTNFLLLVFSCIQKFTSLDVDATNFLEHRKENTKFHSFSIVILCKAGRAYRFEGDYLLYCVWTTILLLFLIGIERIFYESAADDFLD